MEQQDDEQRYQQNKSDAKRHTRRCGKRDRCEVIVAGLDPDQIREVRETWQSLRDRRPDSYSGLVALHLILGAGAGQPTLQTGKQEQRFTVPV